MLIARAGLECKITKLVSGPLKPAEHGTMTLALAVLVAKLTKSVLVRQEAGPRRDEPPSRGGDCSTVLRTYRLCPLSYSPEKQGNARRITPTVVVAPMSTYTFATRGAWRSLVARSVRDAEAVSSSLTAPTGHQVPLVSP